MKTNLLKANVAVALAASLLYCIPLYIFLAKDAVENVWMLYMGNLLFGITVLLYMHYLTSQQLEAELMAIVGSGIVTTFLGVVICALLALILLATVIPNYFTTGWAAIPGNHSVQHLNFNNGQLTMAVYMSLVIGNMVAGGFVSGIYAYAANRHKPITDL